MRLRLLSCLLLAIMTFCLIGSARADRQVIVQDVQTGNKITIPLNFREVAADRLAAFGSRMGPGVRSYSDEQLAAIYLFANPNRAVRFLGYTYTNDVTPAPPQYIAVRDLTEGIDYIIPPDYAETAMNILPALASRQRGRSGGRYSAEDLAAVYLNKVGHRMQILGSVSPRSAQRTVPTPVSKSSYTQGVWSGTSSAPAKDIHI